ncbi:MULTISPECIES: outer membrane protein assembly factor BamE [Basfia]|uniref:Outer membrane protein assembly factor BamE n=2 Tax=Basfia TaxID=697331 RepID=Q65R91_MANSM|nr:MULTISPECIES: outer membrane protein assembly factor BamE [Basfia]AAU38519.1 SmpA protein [[Mannheimia] succiniciproducens MBEL55E]QIM69127.1 cell envelope protein SmpA [Basfia succiniciproducens]SCY17839.1 Beta-barrel assembly machine subunit BamE [Basfia succiniciproducens]SEP59617.1 Beta-barrel assembly machine subunit BamE [Basfia succiniciproducens]
MQIKPIITALLLALSVTSCSTVSKVVYRVDVPQGNYLESAAVSQLQVGMTREQVQYILGTPVLNDPFSTNTWYYVYLQQRSYETPEQHTLTVNFNQQGTVESFDLDKPLPDQEKQVVNNANITMPESQSTSWWQFWK